MNLSHSLEAFVLLSCLILKLSSAFPEINVTDIPLEYAICDPRAANSEPVTINCLGMYLLQSIILDWSSSSIRTFLRYILANAPFTTVIKRYTGVPERESYQFHQRLWFGNGEKSLFNRVFKRHKRPFGPDLHSGFASSFYENYPFNRDTIVESDNCGKSNFCVKAKCREEHVKNSLITYIENINPFYDYTVFTAAICFHDGPIRSHQVTFSIKSAFGGGTHVTVIYKEDAKEYSPYNVETVFYSFERKGYIGIDNVCDHIFPESWITFPGLKPIDYECGLYPADSSLDWSCLGEKAFKRLLAKPDSEKLQTKFLGIIKKQDVYRGKLESILGEDYEDRFLKLWFDDSNRFRRVFNPYNSSITSGYLTFRNWAEKISPNVYILGLGSQECDKRHQGYMEVKITEYQNIHLFYQSNPMFDIILFTEVFVRADGVSENKKDSYYTPNPRNSECNLTLRTDGGERQYVMYYDKMSTSMLV